MLRSEIAVPSRETSTGEIAPDFGGKAALVVYERDGKPLDDFRIVMPGDKRGGRNPYNKVPDLGLNVSKSVPPKRFYRSLSHCTADITITIRMPGTCPREDRSVARSGKREEARRDRDRLRGEVLATHQAGRPHETLLTAGQTAGGIKEILPVAEIMRFLVGKPKRPCRGRWTFAETAAWRAVYRDADRSFLRP